MKRILALLLTLLLLLSSFTFTFAEELIDTDFTFTEEAPVEEPIPDDEPAPDAPQAKASKPSKDDFTWFGTTIIDYEGPGGKVVIPKDWGVTAIDGYAFYKNTSVTSISLPATVKTIGDGAFEECENLESVTLASGLLEINSEAFQGCTALKSIKLPDSVTYLGESAFNGCTSLKSATLPKNLKVLPDNTFYQCGALTTVKLPTALQSIGDQAFYACESLKSISFPSGLNSIGEFAFRGCKSLPSVKLPKDLQTLKNFAFLHCTSVKSVTLSECLTEIPEYCFSRCEKLTSIVIPDGVTALQQGAFENCWALKSITLPDSLKEIGFSCFQSIRSDCVFNVYKGSWAHEWLGSSWTRAFRKDYALYTSLSAPQTLDLGTTYSFNGASVPPHYGNGTITFKGSNEKVATVSVDGQVVPQKEGSLTVTCKLEIPGLVKKTATSKHKVVDPKKLTGIRFIFLPSNPMLLAAQPDQARNLAYEIVPETAADYAISWKSSNAKVASVTDEGEVTPLAKGSATVTVTATQGKIKKSASVKVTVVEPDVLYGVKLSSYLTEVSVGDSIDVGVDYQPSTLSGTPTYEWKSSSTKVATVNGDGNVTAVKAGSVTITCTAQYKGVKKSASVKLKVVG